MNFCFVYSLYQIVGCRMVSLAMLLAIGRCRPDEFVFVCQAFFVPSMLHIPWQLRNSRASDDTFSIAEANLVQMIGPNCLPQPENKVTKFVRARGRFTRGSTWMKTANKVPSTGSFHKTCSCASCTVHSYN